MMLLPQYLPYMHVHVHVQQGQCVWPVCQYVSLFVCQFVDTKMSDLNELGTLVFLAMHVCITNESYTYLINKKFF